MTMSEMVSARASTHDIILRIDAAPPLTETLVGQVEQVCGRAEDATEPAVVVLEIAERAGADPRGWPGDVGINLVNKWERALRRLERCSAAVIATVSGHCAGPALELLLVADHRIATPDLRLTSPANSGEPWPGMALHRLANQIGAAAARRLVLFGNDLTAARATALGIVDEIVEPDGSLADTVAYAATLFSGLDGPELAIRRRLLLDATTTSFEDSLGAHLAACDRVLRRVRQVG